MRSDNATQRTENYLRRVEAAKIYRSGAGFTLLVCIARSATQVQGLFLSRHILLPLNIKQADGMMVRPVVFVY